MPKVFPEYKEAARKNILEKAFRVIIRNGYHDTTMNEIAREVGVTKGTLYLYFRSKEALFKGIIDLHREKEMQELEKIIAASIRGDPGFLFDFLLDLHQGLEAWDAEIHAMATRDKKIRKIMTDHEKKSSDMMLSYIREQQESGYIRKDADPLFIVQNILALYQGLTELMVYGLTQAEAHRIWEYQMRTLLDKPGSAGLKTPRKA